MIWSEEKTEKPQHLPPWRIGVCLDCQHSFDYIELERCPLCECRRVASLEKILDNWASFRKGQPRA